MHQGGLIAEPNLTGHNARIWYATQSGGRPYPTRLSASSRSNSSGTSLQFMEGLVPNCEIPVIGRRLVPVGEMLGCLLPGGGVTVGDGVGESSVITGPVAYHSMTS